MIWMISLRMFFVFEVEVLEVLGGFKAWFQQSFCTSESSLSSNALGRLLFIGVWGWVSDTWRSSIGDTCHHLIGPPVSLLTRARIACVIAYTCELACVIAYTCEVACVIAYTC